MQAVSFTDREYAVLYDSLAQAAERLEAEGVGTPTIRSALDKLASWADPAGCDFLALPRADADPRAVMTVILATMAQVMTAKQLTLAVDQLERIPVAETNVGAGVLKALREEANDRKDEDGI